MDPRVTRAEAIGYSIDRKQNWETGVGHADKAMNQDTLLFAAARDG